MSNLGGWRGKYVKDCTLRDVGVEGLGMCNRCFWKGLFFKGY